MPGAPILSLGTYGCNLSCDFCQNWQLSNPLPLAASLPVALTPRQVLELAKNHNCSCAAFTYNEPTIWAEFVVDVAKLCRCEGVKTVLVTNGYISDQAREDLYSVVDAVNVDLKGFSNSFYSELTGGDLNVVKETLIHVARKGDVWLEITNLVIPERNDSSEEIRAMCEWIAESLGTEIPLHFSAFFPARRLTNATPTPIQTLDRAAEIARAAGIKYVYCGNVEANATTFCPNCGAELITRSRRYETTILDAFEIKTDANGRSVGACRHCGARIAGVF